MPRPRANDKLTGLQTTCTNNVAIAAGTRRNPAFFCPAIPISYSRCTYIKNMGVGFCPFESEIEKSDL